MTRRLEPSPLPQAPPLDIVFSNESIPAREILQCGAPRARPIVVDDFRQKSVDVDGDGRRDLSHGEVVSKQINARGTPTESLHTRPGRAIVTLERVLAEVKSGDRHAAAINLSVGTHVDIKRFGEAIGLKGLTPENIARRRDEIIKHLEKLERSGNRAITLHSLEHDPHTGKWKEIEVHRTPRDILRGQRVIDALVEAGCSVYIGAGNAGPGTMSLYALSRRAEVVGSLNEKGGRSPFSSSSGLVTRHARGEYGVRPVSGGIDFTGDGVPDVDGPRRVPSEQLLKLKMSPIPKEILNNELLLEEELARRNRSLPRGPYTLNEYRSTVGLPPLSPQERKSEGEGLVIIEKRDGRYYYRHLSPDPVRGTSYAAPTALAEDLTRRKNSIR